MAVEPPIDKPPLRGADKNVNQKDIKNNGGNVAGVNYGTLIGAQITVNVAIEKSKDLDDVLAKFVPRVQATNILLELKFKTKGISKILTEIRDLIPRDAKKGDAPDEPKNGNDRGPAKGSDEPKVLKFDGFRKLMEACDECSSVFKAISEEITRPDAENLPEETIYLFGLQVEQQQFSLQMNLELFQIYLAKDYSTDVKKLIFEIAINLRAVAVRLAEAPALQQAPPYTQFGPPAQIRGPFPALRPLSFPELSRMVPLYMGWKIRKANPSDFPPDSEFTLSRPPSWTRTVNKPMPFSSDELYLKVLAQISRRARKNCTLQDEYNGLRSRKQKRQVAKLIKDKNEELPKELEWRLAGLECSVRNVGFWRKETRRIKIILKTHWVPGVMGDGGAGLGGVGGGIRLGGRNDGGWTSGAGRIPPLPGPRQPQGGGAAFSYPQQYTGPPRGHGAQDFRTRESDYVRIQSRHSHSRKRAYSPLRFAPVPQDMGLPHRCGPIIEDPSYIRPPAPGYGYGHRPPPNIGVPASQGYNSRPSRPPQHPPPPIPASQGYNPIHPHPPPPMYIHTPPLAHPSVPRFESQESALQTVRSEVSPQEEGLIVDSLLSEWEPPKKGGKGKRRENRRSFQRNNSYGREWALGLDIPPRGSYSSREYRSGYVPRRESTYRPEPSYFHLANPPPPPGLPPRPNFSSGSGLYPERHHYTRSYHSDPGSRSGYSSQSDIEVERRQRRRMQGYRRDSPDLVVEPRAGSSYGGRSRYAETRSPQYVERNINERLRNYREREAEDFMERPRNERNVFVSRDPVQRYEQRNARHDRREQEAEDLLERPRAVFISRDANPSAPLPQRRSSVDNEADEYIVVDTGGGIRRSGNDTIPEDRPRRVRDERIVARRDESARRNEDDISSGERPRRISDRAIVVRREPSRSRRSGTRS